MQTVTMKSAEPHEYAGVSYQLGEEFECEPRHVELMLTIRRAERVAAATGAGKAVAGSPCPGSFRPDRHEKRSGRR